MLAPWKESYDQPRQHIKKQRHYFANKGLSSQGYDFSSGHVWVWDYKESWAPKNWCLWTVVLEKTPESPLYCKEMQPVYPKRDQSWLFIGRTDAKAETPILWPPDGKSWLIWKDPDAGKDWRQEKGMTKDEMAGWHHWLNGRESEWSPGVGMLRFMGSQRVGYDWVTELSWTECISRELKILSPHLALHNSSISLFLRYILFNKPIIYQIKYFWVLWTVLTY